jgi:hypothetical protein
MQNSIVVHVCQLKFLFYVFIVPGPNGKNSVATWRKNTFFARGDQYVYIKDGQ